MGGIATLFQSLFIAIRCLTIVPVPGGNSANDRAIARSRLWYPLVGLAIGALLASASLTLRRSMDAALVAAAITAGLWTIVTGALHLDGLADCCDGWFARGSRERRLEIMRDPHAGTFGVAAIVLCLLLKTAALAALDVHTIIETVVAATVAGRSAILVVAPLAPYARPQGTGKVVIDASSWLDCVWALTCMAIFGAVSDWRFAAALIVLVFLVGAVIAGFCRWRLGGITGDCLGAACEITETIVLIVGVAAGSSEG